VVNETVKGENVNSTLKLTCNMIHESSCIYQSKTGYSTRVKKCRDVDLNCTTKSWSYIRMELLWGWRGGIHEDD